MTTSFLEQTWTKKLSFCQKRRCSKISFPFFSISHQVLLHSKRSGWVLENSLIDCCRLCADWQHNYPYCLALVCDDVLYFIFFYLFSFPRAIAIAFVITHQTFDYLQKRERWLGLFQTEKVAIFGRNRITWQRMELMHFRKRNRNDWHL